MSILIHGMEMPKDCPMCPLAHWDFTGEFRGCKVVNGKKYAMETESGYPETNFRPSWCPLVPVPPHGRLIDADVLLERFEKEEKAADEHGRDFSFSFKSGGENCTEWWPVQVMLMDAPTIIPADPAKEGEG